VGFSRFEREKRKERIEGALLRKGVERGVTILAIVKTGSAGTVKLLGDEAISIKILCEPGLKDTAIGEESAGCDDAGWSLIMRM